MPFVKKIKTLNDIPDFLIGTPVEKLIHYHNFNQEFIECESAELLIAMCMDNRKRLNIPEKFAFILRTGGANVSALEFKISFAVAMAGLKYCVVIGHTNCGMVGLKGKRSAVVSGLVEHAGWSQSDAEVHFDKNVDKYHLDNELDFTIAEAKRLHTIYKKQTFVPLLYKVEDNKLYLIEE